MSFDRLALALVAVDLAKASEIELVRIIRASVNEGQSDMNRVTLSTGLVIAKALKQAHFKGKDQAIRYIAEGY